MWQNGDFMMKAIWEYLIHNLFCERTKLFYDFVDVDNRGRFENYLPNPTLIRHCVPNPCGWGSGMEDSMINGSCMLEAAIRAYTLTHDNRLPILAKKFFEGMKTCASVSESEGFLARSVSPADGKTHYIDSSRDQYTHWISAAVFYYRSGLADEEDMEFIRGALCAFAKRCRKNVTAENNWNLMREDGKRGIVTSMWNVQPHEMMRLPMFYLAAWKLGGDESFKEDYLNFRDTALEASENIILDSYERLFPINQMQISLKFVYEHDSDKAFRHSCYRLMKKCADYGYLKTIELSHRNTTNKELLCEKAKPWNKLSAAYQEFFEGYAYYIPMGFKCLAPGSLRSAWLIREIGDAAAVYTALPDAEYPEEFVGAIKKTVCTLNLEEHTSDAPIYLLNPYYITQIEKNK